MKINDFAALVTGLTGSIVLVGLMLIGNSLDNRDNISQVEHDNLVLSEKIVDMTTEADLLRDQLASVQNRLQVLEDALEGDRSRTIRTNKVAEVIRKTLPDHPGCTHLPTPSEINQIAHSVVEYGDRYTVSPSLILGIIRRESAFCIDIVSPAGAQGLMQLMPETAESQAMEIASEVRYTPNPAKIKDNIWIGTYYISKRLADFRGNEDLALKAYNAGIVHVKKVLSGERADYYQEPKIYSKKVLEYKEEYRKLGIE
jgi:soluble lytic murein transglycosylase